jgi:antitoxin CptB
VLTATDRSRIRWRCRRGMLENDIVLTRFLDERGDTLSEEEADLLVRLLDLPDNELWDVIAGRAEAPDPSLQPLVAQLRG